MSRGMYPFPNGEVFPILQGTTPDQEFAGVCCLPILNSRAVPTEDKHYMHCSKMMRVTTVLNFIGRPLETGLDGNAKPPIDNDCCNMRKGD